LLIWKVVAVSLAVNLLNERQKVTQFKVGDRVAADNAELCGHCFYCRRGEYLLCENVR